MINTVLTKVPHRWRNIATISFACLIIYSAFKHVQKDDNQDLQRTLYLVSDGPNSNTLLVAEQYVPPKLIYGDDQFISRLPRLQADFDTESSEEYQIRELRRDAIKKSFLHGWNGYKVYAMGADELKPLSKQPHNPFGGLGATLVDSLSTMLVMELDEEFEQVLPKIEQIKVRVNDHLSVFETIIRYMGGLLSAYELSDHSKRQVLLDKAEEIGLALLPAFNTSSGLPFYKFNPVTGFAKSKHTYLADAGTVQLEFFTLSYHTGNPIFAEKAQAITDFLDKYEAKIPGLYPYDINTSGNFQNSVVSFGAMGDSAYEYFLKEYILSDGHEAQLARMYQQSIDSMKSHMLRQIPGSKFLYLPPYDLKFNKTHEAMDHLTCFAPGMLAMGAKIFNRPDDMVAAKGLLETCVHMYRSTATNLSPERWGVGEGSMNYDPKTYGKSEEELSHKWWVWQKLPSRPNVMGVQSSKNRTMEEVAITPLGMVIYDSRYLLRPETVESLYIMYRLTADPIYQEYGWVIYKALEDRCRTDSAYASLKNVKVLGKASRSNQVDSMETFLFAETFKYLYLLFSSPDVISLDKFVLNTEAHPLLRRPWTLDLKKKSNKI